MLGTCQHVWKECVLSDSQWSLLIQWFKINSEIIEWQLTFNQLKHWHKKLPNIS